MNTATITIEVSVRDFTPAALEAELVRRAIERADAEIDRLQDQVTAMMDKQSRRLIELEKLQAKGGA